MVDPMPLNGLVARFEHVEDLDTASALSAAGRVGRHLGVIYIAAGADPRVRERLSVSPAVLIELTGVGYAKSLEVMDNCPPTPRHRLLGLWAAGPVCALAFTTAAGDPHWWVDGEHPRVGASSFDAFVDAARDRRASERWAENSEVRAVTGASVDPDRLRVRVQRLTRRLAAAEAEVARLRGELERQTSRDAQGVRRLVRALFARGAP
ncbi:hypothetical protein EKO23_17480 [Nocardioides guangzhouensis]|uniref:Uncharacterized protein n=1 Tax=Nocardioides guangzhouensis TaxID=2497878 RepID=A0A4Q4Z7W9_9ACTN|nr:hypothetical protein [Nocardioides guangzhouensis]RYP83873.1 hypothetical protein EKO23_17480 [Nocardioides guangzhouensis]